MVEKTTGKSTGMDRAEHHTALAVGLMIGRYEIISVLGQGGFGITYLCHDTRLHRDVAIKEYLPSGLAIRQGGTAVLPRSTEMSKDFVWGRSRFLDEARTMARLGDAPAVVRVHDFLEAHGTAYVVMQLLEGETLEQRLKREPRLSQSMIDRILPPLLDGLEQIHVVGFLHRDIKPANIMLAADGSPTLIDFGASRAAVPGHPQAMTAVFTPGYAAPEQSTSGKQGPWTDIYSLAATLYTCVGGRPPPSVMDRVFENASASAFEIAGEAYAPALLMAIDAGLQLHAGARPQSIAVWRRVLAGAVWNAQPAAPALPPDTHRAAAPAPTEPPRPQAATAVPALSAAPRRGAWALAAIAAFVVTAGGYAALAPAWFPLVPGAAAPPQAASVGGAARPPLAAVRRQAEELALAPAVASRAVADEKAQVDALAKVEEQTGANAERAEAELRLTNRDRQKLQVALRAVGFDVAGIDGTFGPRSRRMIAAWQARRGDPGTGYFTAAQSTELLSDGAPAITRWEEAQRRAYADERQRQQQLQQEQQQQQKPQPPPQRSGWRWPWE